MIMKKDDKNAGKFDFPDFSATLLKIAWLVFVGFLCAWFNNLHLVWLAPAIFLIKPQNMVIKEVITTVDTSKTQI